MSGHWLAYARSTLNDAQWVKFLDVCKRSEEQKYPRPALFDALLDDPEIMTPIHTTALDIPELARVARDLRNDSWWTDTRYAEQRTKIRGEACTIVYVLDGAKVIARGRGTTWTSEIAGEFDAL